MNLAVLAVILAACWYFRSVLAILTIIIILLAQLIDNLVYQPLIYSTSIKSTPLEIFIGLEGLEGGCQKNRQEKDSFHDRGLLFLFSSVG